MPRCEFPVAEVDDSAFGFWDPAWGDPIKTITCDRSADAVLVIRHAPVPVIGDRGGRSKWRVCTDHAVDMLDPERQAPNDRAKVIPTTVRGERVLGPVAG